MDWNALFSMLFAPPEASFEGLILYLLLFSIGMVIGLLTGFFGIGGGFLVVPLLHIFAGIPYHTAVGSSLTLILGTSFSGLLRQRASGSLQYSVAGYLAAGSVVGAVLGDFLQDFLFRAAGASQDLFTLMMHTLFLVLLTGIFVLFRRDKESPAGGTRSPLLSGRGPGPMFTLAGSDTHAVSIPLSVLIGLMLGILTGLLGIGGGVLLLPILMGLFGLFHKEAAGTSLAIVFFTSLAAVITKGLTDDSKISLTLTMILMVTSIIGLNIGITLLQKSKAGNFRRYFVYIILLTIILIVIDMTGIITGRL